MMHVLLPLVSFALTAGSPVERDVVTPPRVAQVQLAEALASADSIESVSTDGRMISFAIVRDGVLVWLAATTDRDGAITSLVIEPAGPVGAELHSLSWLSTELQDATAVVRLVPSAQGVLLSTNDGRRYLVSPQQAPRTGNEAVDARWGAAWSSSSVTFTSGS